MNAYWQLTNRRQRNNTATNNVLTYLITSRRQSELTFSARWADVGGHVAVTVERLEVVVTDTAVLADARQTRR